MSGISGYHRDSEGVVEVHVDGACANNGRSNAAAGIGVHWGDGHPMNVSERVEGKQTNNAAEIQAATRAINQAHEKGITKLRVHTDSRQTERAVNEWMDDWRGNDYKNVENKEYYQALDTAIQKLDRVEMEHVRAHSGNYGNEEANRLAQEATKKRLF